MITNGSKKKEKMENKRRKLDLSFSPVNPEAIVKDSASWELLADEFFYKKIMRINTSCN